MRTAPVKSKYSVKTFMYIFLFSFVKLPRKGGGNVVYYISIIHIDMFKPYTTDFAEHANRLSAPLRNLGINRLSSPL